MYIVDKSRATRLKEGAASPLPRWVGTEGWAQLPPGAYWDLGGSQDFRRPLFRPPLPCVMVVG